MSPLPARSATDFPARTTAPVNGDLCLRLAGRACRISGIPESWQAAVPAKLAEYRLPHLPAGPSANALRIQLADPGQLPRPEPQGHDLNETSSLDFQAKSVAYTSDWCSGILHLEERLGMDLICDPQGGPYFAGMLENALRLITAYDLLYRGGVLLHSAAIVKGGGATILFGHSGAGKSTASRFAMAQGCPVLSDDINALVSHNGNWRAEKLPFCGSVGDSTGAGLNYPVHRLLRLQKDRENRIAVASPAEAVSLLMGSAPFVNQDPLRRERLMDVLQTVADTGVVGRLYFSKDAHFLDLIC